MNDTELGKMLGTIESILSPERIRLNLLLVSLYITAFELLRISIVRHLRDFFVFYPGCGENAKQLETEMKDRYKQEIGMEFSTSDNHLFRPSCNWLQRNGVLNEEDSTEAIKMRDLRNRFAHELPELIFSEDTLIVDAVNLEHLKHIREIIRKVGLFYISIDMGFDVSDEDISGAESSLDLIISTVFDYLSPAEK